MNEETELVDLVDKNGVIQKRKVPRNKSDIFPDYFLQIVIVLILDNDGKVLVLKRSGSLDIDPNHIDNICGAISSGESPEEAAKRETEEESGIKLKHLKLITKGVNKYNRYRYLFITMTDQKPKITHPEEVEMVKFESIESLRKKQKSGEYKFVGDFFEDLEAAIETKNIFL